MREIIFRGKRIDNGEWAYGSLVYGPEDNEIGTIVIFEEEDEVGFIFGEDIEVDLNTVGQYTGLLDKNNKKIFEGDILKLDNSLDTNVRKFEVKFAYGQFYIGINKPVAYVRDGCEVIGNINDNPELLF